MSLVEPWGAARRHDCSARRRVIGLQINGVAESFPLFCPLCGALMTSGAVRPRRAGMDAQPSFPGPRCPHGYPDAPCADVIAGDRNTVFGLMDDIDGLEDEVRTSDPSVSGYVYAITNGEAVKIGWSASHPGLPAGRMAQLQTAQAQDLKLLGAVLATPQLERILHSRFAEHRIRGEWFRCVPEIVEYFEE